MGEGFGSLSFLMYLFMLVCYTHVFPWCVPGMAKVKEPRGHSFELHIGHGWCPHKAPIMHVHN